MYILYTIASRGTVSNFNVEFYTSFEKSCYISQYRVVIEYSVGFVVVFTKLSYERLTNVIN